MKLVIDISDDEYRRWKEDGEVDAIVVRDALMHGTPIPKGHGRLIDADGVKQIVKHIDETYAGWGMTGETAIRLIHEAFNRAPTIIEAEKGSEK